VAKKRVRAGNSRTQAAHRRALFIEAMCTNGRNATQAAVTAGYSAKTAKQAGSRLMTIASVKKAVADRGAVTLAAAQETTQLTADEVIASLARDVRFDPAKLYRADGTLRPIQELDEDTRLALRGVEVDEIAAGRGEDRVVIGRTSKIKFPEKTAAREQGMKHFGLYELDNRQKPALQVAVGLLTVGLEFDKVRARARKLAVA